MKVHTSNTQSSRDRGRLEDGASEIDEWKMLRDSAVLANPANGGLLVTLGLESRARVKHVVHRVEPEIFYLYS